MRLIGKIENKDHSARFSDYLTHQNIDNQIIEDENVYEVWVETEDEVDNATNLLKQFLENPDKKEYRDAVQKATILKKKEKNVKGGASYIDVRTKIFNRPMSRSNFTLFMVILCVLITLLSELGQNHEFLRKFFITDVIRQGNRIYWSKVFLPEVFRGEIWRLITPVFIHFGPMHILFNMLWLWDLGRMIESRKGALFLGFFIVIVAIPSHIGQYLVSGPSFGGMSGVVYGLLGYIWMKGKHDPASGLALHKTTVTMMIIWYFLCLSGIIGHIANTIHTIGLVIGVAWGYFSSPKFNVFKEE